MARGKKRANGVAELSFEAQLWKMADALRDNLDAAEDKHAVLGLISLRCISDAFEAKHAELAAELASGADPEDPDEYRAAAIFSVPKRVPCLHLKASPLPPTIGTIVDYAMAAIERNNPSLQGAPPAGNATFAWVQHFLHHLAPSRIAAFVAANGSKSSNQSGEGASWHELEAEAA